MDLSIQKTKVLLVDDDELCGRSLLRQLTSHEVLQAGTYEQARAILGQTFVDIVVTDNAMPTRNGIDLLRLVAQLQPQAVRVMFSGNPPENLHQLLEAGLIHQFFAKPADEELSDFLCSVKRGEPPAPRAQPAAASPKPAAPSPPPRREPGKPTPEPASAKEAAAPPPRRETPLPAAAKPATPPPPPRRETPLPTSAKPSATPPPPPRREAPRPTPEPASAKAASGEALRRDKRHTASRLVEVHCKTWKQFIRVYIQDISRGGMFLLASDPPAVDSTLEIRIVPPGGDALTLTARVVHVITPDEAVIQQRKPGVGVAFENLDEDQRRHVQALVQIARLNQESARKVPPPLPPARKRPPQPPPGGRAAQAEAEAEAEAEGSALRVEELFDEEPRGKTGTYSIVSDFAIEKIRKHIELRQYRQAERQLQAIVSEQPYNARAQILLYLVQARQLKVDGSLEQAIVKYQAVLELDENNAEAVREVRAFYRAQRESKGFLSRVLARKTPPEQESR